MINLSEIKSEAMTPSDFLEKFKPDIDSAVRLTDEDIEHYKYIVSGSMRI